MFNVAYTAYKYTSINIRTPLVDTDNLRSVHDDFRKHITCYVHLSLEHRRFIIIHMRRDEIKENL